MFHHQWNAQQQTKWIFNQNTILSLFSLSVGICCSPLFILSLFLSFTASSSMKWSITNEMDFSSVTQFSLSPSLPLSFSLSLSLFSPFWLLSFYFCLFIIFLPSLFLSLLDLYYIIDKMLNKKQNGFFIGNTILSLSPFSLFSFLSFSCSILNLSVFLIFLPSFFLSSLFLHYIIDEMLNSK